VTLHVPFNDFVPTVKRVLGVSDVYLRPLAGGVLLTAAQADLNIVVMSRSSMSVTATEDLLERNGVAVWPGFWGDAELAAELSEEVADTIRPFIAAIAYRSDEDRPGLWVDAFESEPTAVQAIEAMYHEFLATGQVEEISFENFIERVKANVVVLSPEEQVAFALAKRTDSSDCPPEGLATPSA
jgi:hypothetical protein